MATDEAVIAEILALEEKRGNAISNDDWATVEALHDDDLVYSHTNGKVENKEQNLAGNKARHRSVKRAPARVQVYGDTAVLTGRVEFIFDDRTIDATSTQVWAKRNGEWKVVAFHASKVDPAFA